MILKFSSEQSDFLNKELKLNVKADKGCEFNKEERQKILNYCMDVEIYEVEEAEESTDGILSNRGEIAADICNILTS